MKKIVNFGLILILLAGLFALPVNGADNRYRVAVLPFDDGSIQSRWWGNNWDVGKGVADELVTQLLETGKFRLVEREQIDRILREQDLGSTGRVDSDTAAKIGKILGVHYLITGRITEFSTDSKGGTIIIPNNNFGFNLKSNIARVAIEARLIDATSAEIRTSVTGTGEKKQTNFGLIVNWNLISLGSNEFKKTNLGIALHDAVASVAAQLSEKAYDGAGPSMEPEPISGLVADTFGHKVYITCGISDGVQVGMAFIVHHVIRVVKNPATGEVIDHITEPVAEITIIEVKDKSAIGVVSNWLNNRHGISGGDIAKEK
jgi:curli biogenesis system outer membrane secretion channel CsgG